MISLEAYCICRIALAEKMLRDHDPRLRAAFTELRREMFADSVSQVIDASKQPALVRLQAG